MPPCCPRGLLLFAQDRELAVPDRQHLESVHRKTIMVSRGEIEDPRGPHEPLGLLYGVPHRGRSDASRSLHRVGENEKRVEGMPAKSANFLLELPFILRLVSDEHASLRVVKRKLVGNEQPSAGEDDPLGRLAGRLHVPDASRNRGFERAEHRTPSASCSWG